LGSILLDAYPDIGLNNKAALWRHGVALARGSLLTPTLHVFLSGGNPFRQPASLSSD
jgi:hypothetical protein